MLQQIQTLAKAIPPGHRQLETYCRDAAVTAIYFPIPGDRSNVVIGDTESPYCEPACVELREVIAEATGLDILPILNAEEVRAIEAECLSELR